MRSIAIAQVGVWMRRSPRFGEGDLCRMIGGEAIQEERSWRQPGDEVREKRATDESMIDLARAYSLSGEVNRMDIIRFTASYLL